MYPMKQLQRHRFFPWLIVLVLVMSNIVSYNMAKSYFRNVNRASFEEESVNGNLMGSSGSRLIDMARDVMRFFKNPDNQ